MIFDNKLGTIYGAGREAMDIQCVKKVYKSGFRILIYLIRIRIQHVRLNTDPDLDLGFLISMTKNLKKIYS
jgi:hypothetical protein